MVKGTKARPQLAEVVDIRPGVRAPEMGPDAPRTVTPAPSDFAFLWDECPRCFYLKVVCKQGRPPR